MYERWFLNHYEWICDLVRSLAMLDDGSGGEVENTSDNAEDQPSSAKRSLSVSSTQAAEKRRTSCSDVSLNVFAYFLGGVRG